MSEFGKTGFELLQQGYHLEQDGEDFVLSKSAALVAPGLWVLTLTRENWMTFAFFELSSQSEENTLVRLMFHGEGPVGTLRECRHTYWGEQGSGYIFYPNTERITAALTWLSKFYEMR